MIIVFSRLIWHRFRSKWIEGYAEVDHDVEIFVGLADLPEPARVATRHSV